MASVGDIIRITSCKELFDETICNVFWYVVTIWTGNSSALSSLVDFQAAEHNAISPAQTSLLTYTHARWDNLTQPSEVAEYINPSPPAGALAGDAAPTFTAYSMQLVRTDFSTRHGYKRIGGVAEGVTVGQDQTLAGATITGMQIFMGQDFVNTVSDQFSPVIVGRDAFGQPDLTRVNLVKEAILQTELTTQTTRKAGRGI